MAHSQIVQLNVGGHYFTTTTATLCKDSDSMLCKMFSRDWDMPSALLDDDGRFFIDRDGSRFATILAHFRGDIVDVPDSSKEQKALQAEATYYQVKHESYGQP